MFVLSYKFCFASSNEVDHLRDSKSIFDTHIDNQQYKFWLILQLLSWPMVLIDKAVY